VPAPISMTTQTRDLTVSQYFDYVSVSDFLLDQAIDPMVENISEELGYRAGLTVNRICLNAIDAEAVSDATTSRISLADAEFMSRAIAARAVMTLRARDIKPSDGEWFVGIIHPLIAYDLLNDNTNGGTIDVLKHVDSGVNEMRSGIRGNRVLNLNGIRWVETTTVGTVADFPSSGDTGYHSYVFGKDAFFVASLGATEVKGDKNFSLMVKRYNDASVADPVNVIGATIGYNFKFGIVKTTGSINKFRQIRGESSIS
jgi:N4-gp56 family major capsid protein